MQATKTYYTGREEVLQLWCHETCRVIADRMWDMSDKEWLRKQLDEKLGASFSHSYDSLFEPFGEHMPPFVTFMRNVGGVLGVCVCWGGGEWMLGSPW